MKIKQLMMVGLVSCWFFQFSAPAQMSTNYLAMFQSGDLAKEYQAVSALALERKKNIEQLIGVLEGDFPREAKWNAAKELGIYRATEAVGALIKSFKIDFDPAIVTSDTMVIEDKMPMAMALERIGNPAVPALIEEISKTNDPRMAQHCAFVCLEIDGQKVAKFKFQQAIEAETDPVKKARLQTASGYLVGISWKASPPANMKTNQIIHVDPKK